MLYKTLVVYVAELLAVIKCASNTPWFDGRYYLCIIGKMTGEYYCCGVMLQGSVVEVQWEGNHLKNVYRLGHKGRVCILDIVW